MSKKQYINHSNSGPTIGISTPWLLALSVYVLNWPTWLYGVSLTLLVLFTIGFIIKILIETGVDVVNRKDS